MGIPRSLMAFSHTLLSIVACLVAGNSALANTTDPSCPSGCGELNCPSSYGHACKAHQCTWCPCTSIDCQHLNETDLCVPPNMADKLPSALFSCGTSSDAPQEEIHAKLDKRVNSAPLANSSAGGTSSQECLPVGAG